MLDIKSLPDTLLTLFNEFGERYDAGDITTFTKGASKIKMRWTCADQMENVSPFTHAMLRKRNKVVAMVPIIPFEPGSNPREIELEFPL